MKTASHDAQQCTTSVGKISESNYSAAGSLVPPEQIEGMRPGFSIADRIRMQISSAEEIVATKTFESLIEGAAAFWGGSIDGMEYGSIAADGYPNGVLTIRVRTVRGLTVIRPSPVSPYYISYRSPNVQLALILEFPSGDHVQVVLQNFIPEQPPFPATRRLIDMVDALASAAAEGNVAAARELYRALKDCRNAYSDRSAMEEAIRVLSKTGKIMDPGGGSQGHVPTGVDPSAYEEGIRDRFEKCEGITPEQLGGAESWLQRPVELGDFLATRYYAREVGINSQQAYELYRPLRDRGHVSAANALAIFYRKGIPENTGGQPDYVLSYAFSYVTFKIYEAAFESSSSAKRHNRIQNMENGLAAKGSYLTPEQQAYAESVAMNLIRDNTNCCIGGWSGF